MAPVARKAIRGFERPLRKLHELIEIQVPQMDSGDSGIQQQAKICGGEAWSLRMLPFPDVIGDQPVCVLIAEVTKVAPGSRGPQLQCRLLGWA